MARWVMMFGAALLTAAAAAPLAAQSVDEDVKCLLASNVFSRAEKDPQKKQLAMAASVFYLGRLDARISTAQLKTAVTAQAKTMPAASLGPIMTACARRLAAKGVALQTLNVQQAPPAAKPK